jgi:hypothetical protein
MERTIATSQKNKPKHTYFEHSFFHHNSKVFQPFWMQTLQHTINTKLVTLLISFKSQGPFIVALLPLLHNSHHFPPCKNKTTNVILIPKLSHKFKNKLIITSRFPSWNLSMDNKTTKQKTIFDGMTLIEISLST